MRQVEFWPDYGGALLHEEGRRIPLDSLGLELPPDLVGELDLWLAKYEDARLELATRDKAWMEEGQRLFARLGGELARSEIELVDWEGYWKAPEG
jgi:hypothetical protein